MPVSAPLAGAAAQSADAPARQAAQGPGSSLTLLVIEDDPAGALSVPRMLDAYGRPVRVRTARNLTEAARLLTDDVHCILLDLALPYEVRGDSEEAPSEGFPAELPEVAPPGAIPGIGGVPGTAAAAAPAAGAVPQPGSGDLAGPGSGSGSGSGSASGSGSGSGSGAGSASDAAAAPVPAPGSDELQILRRVLRMAPRHAVLALTDGSDAERAAEAVRVGAQDYLFRDELDGRLLMRAIRYAVERKRADLAQRQLTETRLRAQENARLERGLLPRPLLEGSELRFAARYRPGRSRALLGGDFYDTVRTSDGVVHAMIGDVCGHGPDEAALGVELRIAWRALTFAGLSGDALLSTLQKVLENERASEEIFATLCTVDIAADGRSAGVCLAGHPSPLFAGDRTGTEPRLLPEDESGPALGLLPQARWPRRQVTLGPSWSLLMYTDGLIEGRVDEGRVDEGRADEGPVEKGRRPSRERLGQQGMLDIVAARMAEGAQGERLLDETMDEVRRLNGGELTDDVAVLLLDRGLGRGLEQDLDRDR
ncbi:fused response regulator/phosphatase [Streptomyces spirodelae]|uniref:SpoIIE family protein phosphatase n=1 Tax=Streptomyces spirodelae TaxID=2812904 RepID=A0ABS3WYS6_9ACTN|nr:fused response regulator/phosphatase [Streptomyces spirodelae]MBO8188001.1 SpoIIE family protein phosphatase [Streptomyces spirodelae]